MPMSVMQIWIVRVLVPHRCVMMPVRVRFSGWIAWTMGVLVMIVVHVAMVMVQRLMGMLVLMSL